MRKLTFILLITMFSGANAQSILSFGPEIEIANGFGNLRPRITLSNGTPVVIWGGGSDEEPVYSSRYNGTSFTSPLALHPTSFDVFTTWWAGPDVASYGDTVYVAFKGVPEDSLPVYLVKSTDGGLSFGDTIPVTNWGVNTRFPEIETDDQGNPVLSFMDFLPGWADPQYAYQKSPDGGTTWTTKQDISLGSGGEVCDCCESELITFGQNHILAYRSNNANTRDMWLSHSDDGGQTFSNELDVDESDWFISVCPSSGPDIAATQDSIFIVWMSGASGKTRVRMTSMAKSNVVFSGASREVRPNSQTTVYQNFPRIESNGSALGVVWENTAAGNKDIYILASQSGSTGIGDTSYMVNSDPTGYQRNADIAIDDNNVMHVVWQDDQAGTVKYRQVYFSALGVENVDKTKVQIYPNPSSDYVEIVSQGVITELKIYNVKGQLIHTDNTSREKSSVQDVSFLSPGNYMFQLKLGNNNIIEKAVVVK